MIPLALFALAGFAYLAAVWGLQGHFGAAGLALLMVALSALQGAEIWRRRR